MEKIFQVSEFNEYINLYLKQSGVATIEGEISEFKVSQDKWLYVTLKDATANLPVFAVAYNISGWRSLEVGMKVQVVGTPGVFSKYGKFSFNASQIVPAGEGAIKLAFEKLRRQLEQEGLFETSRKRTVIEFPRAIGLITAKNSDAYNDVVKILKNRFGGIKIYFYPVQVQGKSSAGSVVEAFKYFNDSNIQLDAIILTRGGGSLEDLQSFNDELVVRAVFGSRVPVICGVGHERDISLSDLAADIRASTPSNAAELLVKHRDEYINKVTFYQKQLNQLVQNWLALKTSKLEYFVGSLYRSINKPISNLENLNARLLQQFSIFESKILQKRQQQENLNRLLSSLSYHQTLRRGFSIARDASGKIITSITQALPNQNLSLQVFDGKIISTITSTTNEID